MDSLEFTFVSKDLIEDHGIGFLDKLASELREDSKLPADVYQMEVPVGTSHVLVTVPRVRYKD